MNIPNMPTNIMPPKTLDTLHLDYIKECDRLALLTIYDNNNDLINCFKGKDAEELYEKLKRG